MIDERHAWDSLGSGRPTTDWKAERSCFIEALHERNNIPLAIVERVADEIGSVRALKDLYRNCQDRDCCAQVLSPLLEDIVRQQRLSGSAIMWSTAVYNAIFAVTYLPPAVVDPSLTVQRQVEIELAREHVSIFHVDGSNANSNADDDQEASFYRLIETDRSRGKISTIRIRTTAGLYCSSTLAISIMDGNDILCYLKTSLIVERDCTKAAVAAGAKIVHDLLNSSPTNTNKTTDNVQRNSVRRVLLVRGMNCAIDKAAKQNGFRPELRVLGTCTPSA
jgi:hypothetical protein